MDFFTSDWHLNDELVREKCGRKFKDAARMNEVIIKQANQRATKADNIIHVGDFIQRGLDRGTGLARDKQLKAADALKMLDANVLLLEGNHDENNCCNTVGKVLFRKVGKFDCIVQHYPSMVSGVVLADGGKFTVINICGHVHDKWAFKYDADRNVLNVNVGIDIYPYMIKECDLAQKIEAELKKLGKTAYRFL